MGSPLDFLGDTLLLIIFYYYFFLLRPVTCMPNVVIASGLSILDCPFGFLKRLYYSTDVCEILKFERKKNGFFHQ